MPPHIAVLHVDNISLEYFADFTETVRAERLDLLIESRPSGIPFAGIEWLMPTAIVAYIAKPYFESFLQEMGKDHYLLVKEGLKRLYLRVASPQAPSVSIVSTIGKTKDVQPYSLFFSVVFEGPNGISFKLLIPKPISAQEYESAVSEFLEFAVGTHQGTLSQEVAKTFEEVIPVGRTVLVAYDVEAKRLRPIDPLTGRRG